MQVSQIHHAPHENSLATFICLATALSVSAAFAQQYGEPVVARVEMRWHSRDETHDVIEKGDLLTVVEERQDSYLVMSFDGHKGIVAKDYAVRLGDSVAVYDELIKKDPSQGRFYALRGDAWWARAEQVRALEDYNRAIQTGYTTPHAYATRGLLHSALGDHEKAIADCDSAIKLDPQNEASFINRAAAHMARQAYEQAVKDYSEAIGLNGKRASTYRQRAVAWKLLGIMDRANEDFGKAIELDPRSMPALMGRGLLWFQMNMPREAIADFTEVVKLSPNETEAYSHRGYNRMLLGDYANALADFDQAIRIAPEFALAYQNKAWLLACANEADVRNGKQAVAAATKACELHGYEDVNDVKALAAAFAEDGQYDKAVGWQEKVIELAAEEERSYEREIADRYRSEKPFRLPEPMQDDRLASSDPAPVTEDVVPVLTVSPTQVSLGDVGGGGHGSARLVVRGPSPFRILKMECDDMRFGFEISDDAKTTHSIPVVFYADGIPHRFPEKSMSTPI